MLPKLSLNYLLFSICLFAFPIFFYGQEIEVTKQLLDSTAVVSIVDTIAEKESLENEVFYDSKNQYHEVKKRKSFLVTDAKLKYGDFEIVGDYIEIDWNKNQVYAAGKVDSLGKIIVPTTFTQGGKSYKQDKIRFNFKSKEGVAYNVKTVEEDGILLGEKVKRKSDSISYIRGAEYTTDPLYKDGKIDRPDYVLRTEIGKLIDRKDKGKTVITGPISLKIHDVPTPLIAPFALIPLNSKRKAGILVPSFGEREQQGFFLQNGGFYLPIDETVDLTLLGNFFTRGSWGINAKSDYKFRYKNNGSFNLNYENNIIGIKGLSNFSQNKLYRFSWNHRQDPKANPNLVLTSSVNISSSEYFRNSLDNNNIFSGNNVTNTTSSSISLVKTFDQLPFTTSLNLTHNQNNNATGDNISLNLPQLTVNMSRQYPFAPKVGAKKGLLQSLGTDYSMNLINSLTTNDNDFLTSKMFESSSTGLQHNFNFQSGVTALNYFPITLSMNYSDVWVFDTIERTFNSTTNTTEDDTNSGFDSFRTFSLSASTETNLYGQLNFKEKKDGSAPSIKAIRHVLTPRVGLSYRPDFSADFWGYYDTYLNNLNEEVSYTSFSGGVFGSPSSGEQANVNFGISNNLEFKVKNKNQSATDSLEYKKVKIFDYLNLNSSYNFAADSLNFSNLEATGASSLLENKFRINYSASIDPYKLVFDDALDETGTRVNKLGAFRFNRYNVNFSYGFNNDTFRKEKPKKDETNNNFRGKGRYEVFEFNKRGYAFFAMPWTLNFNFNYNANRANARDFNTQSSLGVNGSVQLTPYWNISGSTAYDIENKELTFTRFQFARDLQSFQINFSWSPIGATRAWDFFIGIKSDLLKDTLKYNQRNFANGNQFN